LNAANKNSRSPVWQYTLLSLLAVTVFAGLGLWAWSWFGLLGVTWFVVFVAGVAGNLVIAIFGAKFRCTILAGALGGAFIWSLFAFAIERLDEGGFSEFENSLYFSLVGAFVGVLIGLVSDGYARVRRGPVKGDRRKGVIYCVVLFVAFGTVFGLGRYLALQKLLQPDFNVIRSSGPDSDGTYVLKFWGNGLGDGTFTHHLATIPKNRKLDVSFRHTKVTDLGIRALGGFPNLVRVDLRGTTVSEEGENWLRRTLPDCAVRR